MTREANCGALDKLDGEQRAEYWATLALRRTRGLGARSVCRLLRHFGSAYAAVYAVPRWREAGLDPRKGASLSGGEWRREARPEWEDARDLEGDILLWTDPRYPALLRELPDAPALLYTRGDPGLLLRPCMAVVGSRGCTRSGREQSAAVARELSACGIAVVSGMARGIDRAAHEAALRENGSSIAVLGSGVDVIYPRQCADLYHELCDGGLILSEFPPGSLPQGPHFPIRNRIISGLSLGVVVGEAALKSGSMVTARIALEQNRSVFALLPDEARSTPSGMPPSEGCEYLIEQGARAARGAGEILRDLLPQLQEPPRLAPSASPAPARTTRRPDLPLHPRGQARPIPGPGDPVSGIPAREEVSASDDIAPASPEGIILALLRKHGSLGADEMLELLSEPESASLPDVPRDAGSLSALLIMLEVRGAIHRLPGNMYEVSRHAS
ncbi:MAG TPA: DNA-processing protein DprA [Candidatus Mailhella excrementigallinarum]|nr:MAG: DNA-protecting protein DprA [Desulfovibrionaceae bacterium]HIV66833.1 DNA-processing protein DprA [Candidatus Mailhella excrementigallinarum]